MNKHGRKFPVAVALDENGKPIAQELYTPEDRPARPVGCMSCAAPLDLVEEGKKLGSIRTKRYFRTKGGLSEHFARGCKLDHTRVDREGKSHSLLDYVRNPSETGKRKLLYLNMPANGLVYSAEDALPALTRMQMIRPVDTASGVFSSAAGEADGPSWRVRTGAELAHVAFHPLAHEELIDEIDVISEFHRYPLRRVIGGLEDVYQQNEQDAQSGLSYPALTRVRIEPDQGDAENPVLSWVYGAGQSLYQLAIETRGSEGTKIRDILDKGGEFSLYGQFEALNGAKAKREKFKLGDHELFMDLADLKLLRYKVSRASDILRYKYPANRPVGP